MNKQNLSSLPDENKIEELLTKIQPVPSEGFQQKMQQTHWRRGITNKPHLKLAIAIVALLTVTILATTPQGRAWAQQAMRFFTKINSTTIQLSDEQTRSMKEMVNEANRQYDLPLMPVLIPAVAPEMAAMSGCETPQKSQSYHCQVALAESKLGFDLRELPEKTNSWEFKSISINTDSQYAVTNFDLDFKYFIINNTGFTSYSSLTFIQGLGDFSNFDWYKENPWEAVPAYKVESVSIGAYTGEYVKGRFGLSPDNDKLIWSNADRRQRLIWNEDARWYLIDFQPNLNLAGTMDKDQIIRLAESLVNSYVERNESLNPEHLLSISDAEKISGLDLKAPALLPMDMDFSYARYLPDKQEVQLVYGLNQGLIIHEWKGDPVEYKKPLGKYEFTCETINMNSTDAFYCFFEGMDPRSFLWWHKAGINYQMYYDSFSGGQIDREKMLLIAESMQDINDFQKKSNRDYEQVVLYEQALGIDAKKFQEVPAGWIFEYFWGDPYSQCIGLIYESVTGESTLFINECKTDKNSDTSIFPFRSIKQVKVGSTKGQYIAGSFVITDDGKQVWDPTSPRKQLYWQEDGLWMQVAVYGDEALLSDKDELIFLAESLK